MSFYPRAREGRDSLLRTDTNDPGVSIRAPVKDATKLNLVKADNAVVSIRAPVKDATGY